MKRLLQFLLITMLCISLAAIHLRSWESAILLVTIFGFSVRAYRLANEYRADSDKVAYNNQMKAVYGFTTACAFISFYWPFDMYYNVVLLLCLLFHCCINRYVK